VFIGEFCRIGPGVVISGNVKIGEQTMVGSGAVFLNRLTIGERSLIGAGSVVTKSFPADSMVWGNPATERN
jgi:acetyltransferase-like isoleucine patch superfamily enzyme